MKKMKKAMAVTGCAVLAVGFMAGCGSEKTKEALDLNSMTVAQLEEGAKKEGRIDSVGMPDPWANWVSTWDDLKEKYARQQI